MDKERNAHQIVRKDGKGCFVESLNDTFSIGRCHLAFAAYDLNRPAGERQTNLVQIYLDRGELLELCRKAESGELLLRLQDKKQKGDKTPLYQCMGGTSAEKLRRIGRPRPCLLYTSLFSQDKTSASPVPAGNRGGPSFGI